jgi:hypothetical protein
MSVEDMIAVRGVKFRSDDRPRAWKVYSDQKARTSNSRTLNDDTNSTRSCEAFEPIDQRSPPDETNIPWDAAAHQLSASDST